MNRMEFQGSLSVEEGDRGLRVRVTGCEKDTAIVAGFDHGRGP